MKFNQFQCKNVYSVSTDKISNMHRSSFRFTIKMMYNSRWLILCINCDVREEGKEEERGVKYKQQYANKNFIRYHGNLITC